MEKIEGIYIPLALADIDTDMIIPAGYMRSCGREGYGEHLFERLRERDPSFPTNLPRYRGASIIVARENFGCGSSREHAVWALKQAGIQVIIAPSFADIFASNAAKNGLIAIIQPSEVVEELLERGGGGTTLDISMANHSIHTSWGKKYRFDYDEFRQKRIGMDDLEYLLEKREIIVAHHARSRGRIFLE